MKRPSDRPGTVQSKRGAHWVETRIAGYVRAAHIQDMAAGYERHGGGATWLVDASDTESYEPEAVRAAADTFGRLARERGLERLVTLITRPAIRMGALAVGLSLRAIGARVRVDVVGDRDAFVREALRAP